MTGIGAVDGVVPLLELRGVHASYGRIEVLHGVDLVVPPGKVVALLGPNGAGKTTTLKVANGQMRADAGCVHVAGRHVNGVSPDALARIGVCTIPEGRGVFPQPHRAGEPAHVTLHRCRRRGGRPGFDRFPRLKERVRQVAGTLSGGEQQMLAMARALATDPAAPSPRRAVDGPGSAHRRGAVRPRGPDRREGVSILVVEQFARTVLGVADLAVVMQQGRVVASGVPSELEDELSAAYLGASS